MSETAYKMIGLALMIVSVFSILFGLYPPASAPFFAGLLLAWGGAVVLLVGFILFVVVRKRG